MESKKNENRKILFRSKELEKEKKQVFLSYEREDLEDAERIYESLLRFARIPISN